ncbi:MAG TPA: hypothetical protein VF190_08860 [Rhodothermales bacterium]
MARNDIPAVEPPQRQQTDKGTRFAFFFMMALIAIALLFFMALPFMM